MSVDELIDPPYFPDLDRRLGSSKALIGFFGVFAVFSLFGTMFALGWTNSPVNPFSIAFAAGTLFFSGLVFVGVASKKSAERGLNAAVAEYIRVERARLNEIKSKMSDIEWENYKLQLQNQKLLVQLNNKANVKTQRTTSWSVTSFED